MILKEEVDVLKKRKNVALLALIESARLLKSRRKRPKGSWNVMYPRTDVREEPMSRSSRSMKWIERSIVWNSTSDFSPERFFEWRGAHVKNAEELFFSFLTRVNSNVHWSIWVSVCNQYAEDSATSEHHWTRRDRSSNKLREFDWCSAFPWQTKLLDESWATSPLVYCR